jgi:hypothetical protein
MFLCMYYKRANNRPPHLLARNCFSTLSAIGILCGPLRISIDVVQDLSRPPFRGSDWPQFLQPTYIRHIVTYQLLQYPDEPSSVTLHMEAARVPKTHTSQ